jgi:phage recombination protein Bet
MAEQKAVVEYKGEKVAITFQDVKRLICPTATDQEVAIFLKTCQSLQLNPFAGEIYLIKYTERDRAATVIAIDSYLKAAEANPQYDGHEAGIILRDSAGKLELREGAFLLDEERERLVGGWAKVYRKDRKKPVYVAVHKAECVRYRKDGQPTEFWTKERQPSMLRKVALKRALVEAFPSLFAGALSTAEVEEVPEEVFERLPKPKGEMREGELPEGFKTANGKDDWSKFWARVKNELGLTPQEAHRLLEVDSIKDELVTGRGMTLAEVWRALVARVQAEAEERTRQPKLI